jgi:hypothetical protein
MLFGLGAVLQHSHTPSLSVAGFEDEDDDEAPCGWLAKSEETKRLSETYSHLSLSHRYHDLPDLVIGLHITVRFYNLFQLEGFRDDRFKHTGG